jgi:Asp-tRNA(Asn)/Glu-tRNA(Gln) amidotransferase A subunit family amidase
MSELNKLSMKMAIDGLRTKKFSSTELVNDHIKAIEAQNDLNIFITKTNELALHDIYPHLSRCFWQSNGSRCQSWQGQNSTRF